MCVRVKPRAKFCTHNPYRHQPDDKNGKCVRYKSVKVGLQRFLDHVAVTATRFEQTDDMLSYYDLHGRLCAQLIWNQHDAEKDACEHRLLLQA